MSEIFDKEIFRIKLRIVGHVNIFVLNKIGIQLMLYICIFKRCDEIMNLFFVVMLVIYLFFYAGNANMHTFKYSCEITKIKDIALTLFNKIKTY